MSIRNIRFGDFLKSAAAIFAEALVETHTSLLRPEGIYRELLPPEHMEAIPALRRMAVLLRNLA
jgi:hypothetical protein